MIGNFAKIGTSTIQYKITHHKGTMSANIFSLNQKFGWSFFHTSSSTLALIPLEQFRLLKYFSAILFALKIINSTAVHLMKKLYAS